MTAHIVASWLKSRVPIGTRMYVLPSMSGSGMAAAQIAGMNASFLPPESWPFPELMRRLLTGTGVNPLRQVADRIFHDETRDWIASDLSATANLVVKEVALLSKVLPARADADMLVRPRRQDLRSCMWEIKTGAYSEMRPNQSFVYALGLLGQHIETPDPRVVALGMEPGVPLPQMDFLLMTCLGPGHPMTPYLIPADDVNKVSSFEALTAFVELVRQRPPSP